MACSRPRRSAHRRRTAAGIALAGVVALTACGAPPPEPVPHRVVVAASATANEPAPALTTAIRGTVQAAIDSDAGTLDLVVDTPRGPEPVRTVDLVLRRDAQVEHAAQRRAELARERIAEVDAALRGLAGDAGRIDVLGLLGAVARVPGAATGVVVTSGLQSDGPLGIGALRWELGPDLPDRAAAAGLLPDLRGKTVIFSGLGDVAGDQAPVTQRLRTRLVELWLGVCRRAGAAECRVDAERGPGGPVSTVAAPLIAVPPDPALAVPVDATPAVTELPADLLFAPDSADLRPDAVALLGDVAARLPADGRVLLEGRTATVGPPDAARVFSLRRASACRAALVAAGVPAEHVVVAGLGYDRPLVPDIGPDGALLPAAARNRSVTMTVTIGGPP